ncbi:hypothetical protein [Novosphingobium sp.]|uniref:hypothetical protein n=1 Tax=Novosphingobium sp. TaxID=1874826 RepID=UPI00260A12E4|nr:hypothetical protein [Novosphingobium sp.]
MRFSPSLLLAFVFSVAPLFSAGAAPDKLSNENYTVELRPDLVVTVRHRDGGEDVFAPRFTILSSDEDPGLKQVLHREWNLILPRWTKPGEPAGLTWNVFEAGRTLVLTAEAGEIREGKILWRFPPVPEGTLAAELDVPSDGSEPRIRYTFQPAATAWYSILYSGAPVSRPEQLEELWQPRVWQERRFPTDSVVTTELGSSLPSVMTTRGDATVSVTVDPAEAPFILPRIETSRFGVLLRNAAGLAQPQILAPLIGMPDSRLEAGQSFTFAFRAAVRPGGCYESFRDLSVGLFGFRDLRSNTVSTLNRTLENMVDYAMRSKYSGWNAELRAFDYTTDVKNTVKTVSALHPLSLAVLTDDEGIFRERALPSVEFLLSREKYLFTARAAFKDEQHPSNRLSGPAAEPFEWASLHNFVQRRSPILAASAQTRHDNPNAQNLDTLPVDMEWVGALALWQTTDDETWKARAIAGADAYIAKRITTPAVDFSASNLPGSGQFPTDFVPRWMMLYELYRSTGEKRFLDAATIGARLHAKWCWTWPVIPDGTITVNKGGVIEGGYNGHYTEMREPEETVPAWWVAPQGLSPEASNTYNWNPAVLLACHAPWMLELGAEINDPFLMAIARSAVVGRYSNYPGYTINRFFSTVFMKPDYPTREGDPYKRYNQLYLNHVWPHISSVAHYLFADVDVKSRGAVRFPSRYAQGYVYLQTRVYGDRPGVFYGDRDVTPFLPAGLVSSDSDQLNYLAGHGNGAFYLALSNQSAKAVRATVRIDPARVRLADGRARAARTWINNQPASPTEVLDGVFVVEVPSNGLAAIAIPDAQINAPFQDRFSDDTALPLGPESFTSVGWPLGRAKGSLLSFGKNLTSAYLYLDSAFGAARRAELCWRPVGQDWRRVEDEVFPFEFSVSIPDDVTAIEWRIEATTPDGQTQTTPVQILRR